MHCKDRTQPKPTIAEAEAAIKTIIRYLGDNPNREGLLETPARVIKSYTEIFAGYSQDPVAMLKRTFADISNYDEMVLIKDIRIESHCEHHMIPITGTAHIAYIPNGKIVGISKLARVADAFAKRLQTQELLTVQIANTINDVLKPHGVAVVINASHQCMTKRGVNKTESLTVTSKMIGRFKSCDDLRKEFYNKISLI